MSQEKRKVLLVDDSFIMRVMIRDIVESDENFEVCGEAQNGEEAVKMARQLKPDAILLDIEMPQMNGIGVMKRLKLVGKFNIIIVSSLGQVGSNESAEARKLGAFDVIAKPSGAMSLDLVDKRGHEIISSLKALFDMGEEKASD